MHRVFASDLPVKAAVRFQKTLVAQRPVHPDFPVRADFCRSNHRGQDIFDLRIKILFNRICQHAVQRSAPADEQNRNPRSCRQDHPAGKRSRALELAAPGWRLWYGHNGDWRIQLTGSSRL